MTWYDTKRIPDYHRVLCAAFLFTYKYPFVLNLLIWYPLRWSWLSYHFMQLDVIKMDNCILTLTWQLSCWCLRQQNYFVFLIMSQNEVTHVPEIFLYISKKTRLSCQCNTHCAAVLVTLGFCALSNHFWINTVYFAQSRIITYGFIQKNIFRITLSRWLNTNGTVTNTNC